MENVHLLTFKSCKALALTTDQPCQTPRFLHLTPPYSLSRWSRPQTPVKHSVGFCSTSTVEHYQNPAPSFYSRFIFSIITSFLPAHVLKVISDAVHFISMRTKTCVCGGRRGALSHHGVGQSVVCLFVYAAAFGRSSASTSLTSRQE